MSRGMSQEEAQSRMDELYEGKSSFKIHTWINASSPCIVKCSNCGNEIIVTLGSHVYRPTKGKYLGSCSKCHSLNLEEIDKTIEIYKQLALNVKQAVKNLHKLPEHIPSVGRMWEILECTNVANWQENLFPFSEITIMTKKQNRRIEVFVTKEEGFDLTLEENQKIYYYALPYITELCSRIDKLQKLKNEVGIND